ncbi:hypothetical protein PVAP13_3KG202400 [Panicum virgatum]|uniref:C2H2-type domain-containing protein n=1 Tax=Panicum virgatum TaxID=38727 RepID=A0A8T0UT25_PANVG|nr:hypothetical protein PVAP13_3KG202400 [Panicum virgatum]
MEFWGLEVKPGTTVKCDPSDGYILHLSQAALGESKKSDTALMYVKVDDQKLAIGTLSHDKYPHIPFDLVFDKEFELSHTSKAASVFFSGYKVEQPGVEDEMDFDSEEDEGEEQNIPLIKENGKAQGKEEQKSKAGPAASNSSAAVKDVDKKIKADDDSDEDETDDDSDDDDLSPDEEGNDDDSSDEGDSSEEDEDSEDDEEEETPTPKKPEVGKKRAAENALKTPVSDKKAKVATPSGQKTGGNKGTAHVPTPHPAKKVSKTPANNDKSKEKSPKSGGSVVCKSCSKTFNSDMALQAHSKAKHGAK